MGVAVQKGAGQGILRGDGALGQIGGGQNGQQLHNGKAAARFGDRHAQQGRHLAERVWYGFFLARVTLPRAAALVAMSRVRGRSGSPVGRLTARGLAPINSNVSGMISLF